MTLDEFRNALDIQGADLSQWPQTLRAKAESLIKADAAARSALEDARHLEGLIGTFVASDAGISADIRDRAFAKLEATALPRQHGHRSHWPAILLNLDFAPAWPRVAALACCAVLGVLVGLSGLDQRFNTFRTASMLDQPSSFAAEPEPLTGVRP
jgi:hypothetical protein